MSIGMTIATHVDEIVRAVRDILDDDRGRGDTGVEYFFRGEPLNYLHRGSRCLHSAFPCLLDRHQEWVDHERQLYEDAIRHNVVSFEEDRTMVERIARMQHYQLPTRFADMSDNALLAAHFACDSSSYDCKDKDNGQDGFIRVIKVHPDKMKSFTSDIIVSIAHLPLVDAKNIVPSKNDLGYLRYEVQNERAGFCDLEGDTEYHQNLCGEIQQVWAFRPVLNTRRIRNQGGAFLAYGCGDNKASLNPSFNLADYEDRTKPSWGIAQIGYICVPAECKKNIRMELAHFGMRPEVVYPDLSNVCCALQERYLGNV